MKLFKNARIPHIQTDLHMLYSLFAEAEVAGSERQAETIQRRRNSTSYGIGNVNSRIKDIGF